MNVFLTGGTGLIGSGVLAALLAAGHTVSALARSAESAAAVTARGATAVPGDVTDRAALSAAAREADGVVHTASTAQADSGVLDAVLGALAGTGKPYVHTSGVWTFGSGTLDESTPFDPAAPSAWRLPLDARVRAAAADGVRTVVLAPGIVHGRSGGLPAVLRSAPRTPDGALRLPGNGEQRWTTVHTADLGRLYTLALTAAPAGSYYIAAGGENPTVREIGVAAARGAGGSGAVVGSSEEETRELFGPLAGPLLLDQQATGAKARADLGWAPSEASLLTDLESGSYAGC
ncbi:NAD-dependent epimerase/dehydratase family protein [Geodermatophilus ruber]|uniref:Nucleoside-diphosphate-sugar epimerase n=1 Tax=Geodermatophilus ruber TaxID=504800 RepID=A0A1I4HLB3_9ACTN|nr:NAD-dependent epimerase/dehydratase family protein [Geodermatophilus ruber]SFL43058.1 Nucleoside-diphosphate-sugar epimerase [Geodermatophilus ruber]